MMELKCNLIEYEKITDDTNKRIIFFGRYAGLAGMINTLWSLGLRLKYQGIDTPFSKIKQSHKYNSLQEVRNIISEVGYEISKNGLPDVLQPFTIGITGYGNVSKGVQEILSLLPVKEIMPEDLSDLKNKNLPSNLIYKTVFYEKHISKPNDDNVKFELQDYYKKPRKYRSCFNQYIPHLSVLMNCMYWDNKYPKLVTKEYLNEHYYDDFKLKVIGDITCDPNGSVEITHKGTYIEDPIFVYNPDSEKQTMGHQGKGILVMAVDILPSELPRESSNNFSKALYPFVPAIANANFNLPFRNIDLPKAIKRAMILHKGDLTPEFKYLEKFL